MSTSSVIGSNSEPSQNMQEQLIANKFRRKLKNQTKNKNRNTVVIDDKIVTLKSIISLSILNLDSECYSKIFDWLSLEEVYTFSRTCSHLQRIVSEYYQQNYHSSQIIGLDDGILVEGIHGKIDDFTRFIQSITIYGNLNGIGYGDELNKLQYLLSNCGESLKKLKLINVSLNEEKILSIARVLSKIETLEMNENLIFSFHWEYFFKYCKNLQSLSVVLNKNCEHLWLLHQYPKLKHLKLTTDKYGFSIDELRSFFDQNSTIKSFSTTATYFSCNRNAFKNAKLDELTIQIEDAYKINLKLLANILNEFYERGIYIRLNLHIIPKIEKKNLIYSFIQSLNALHLLSVYDNKISLAPLMNLKELNIFNGSRMKNLKMIATQFINIECIQFYMASSNDILPFVQRSIKLQKIYVSKLEKGTHFNENILNVAALNAERNKLNGAQKIIIYVKENIYLATKWTMTKVNFNLIELKRHDTDDVHHYFQHKIQKSIGGGIK